MVVDAVNDAVGAGAFTTTDAVAGALVPPAFVAVSVTLYEPGRAYVCSGCCAVAVLPSPKSQAHAVGAPVDVSVNRTGRGAVPVIADVLKLAVGAGAGGTPGTAGRRARSQPAEPTANSPITQVTVPVAPASPAGPCASSATCAPVLSQLSAQAEGGATAVALLSRPTPPITMAPLVVLVTPGTVRAARGVGGVGRGAGRRVEGVARVDSGEGGHARVPLHRRGQLPGVARRLGGRVDDHVGVGEHPGVAGDGQRRDHRGPSARDGAHRGGGVGGELRDQDVPGCYAGRAGNRHASDRGGADRRARRADREELPGRRGAAGPTVTSHAARMPVPASLDAVSVTV